MKTILLSTAALLVTFLTQCSKQDTSFVERSSAPAPSKAASTERTLTLFSWDEYFSPEVLTDFTKITGIQVHIETFEDTDEVEQKLRSEPGKYDIIVFDGDKVDRCQELQLLSQLDRDQLPHFKNLEKKHTNLAYDPGNQYSIPYLWGTTLVAYRKDKISNPTKSWNLLWDPALKGHIGMLDERLETLGSSLIKCGFSINNRDPASLALAEKALLQQTQELDARYIEGAPSALEEALSTGDIWATMAYSGDAAMVAQENENIDYFIPEEGCTMWMDHFVVSRDTQNFEEAHAFIDFMLTGPAAAKTANYLRYATPNKAATPHLDKDLLENEGIYPPEAVLAKCEFSGRLTPERERPANKVWQVVVNSIEERNASTTLTDASSEESE